jgi:hypothetical protein
MNGEQYGPCAVCGDASLPKYGVFLCRRHATFKRAMKVKNDEN